MDMEPKIPKNTGGKEWRTLFRGSVPVDELSLTAIWRTCKWNDDVAIQFAIMMMYGFRC